MASGQCVGIRSARRPPSVNGAINRSVAETEPEIRSHFWLVSGHCLKQGGTLTLITFRRSWASDTIASTRCPSAG